MLSSLSAVRRLPSAVLSQSRDEHDTTWKNTFVSHLQKTHFFEEIL